jgi:hypothetical protein
MQLQFHLDPEENTTEFYIKISYTLVYLLFHVCLEGGTSPLPNQIQMNNAISRQNIILGKNNGYTFWLNSLAIIGPNYMNTRGGHI